MKITEKQKLKEIKKKLINFPSSSLGTDYKTCIDPLIACTDTYKRHFSNYTHFLPYTLPTTHNTQQREPSKKWVKPTLRI